VSDQPSPDPVDLPTAPVDAPAVDAPEVGTGEVARQHPVFVYTLLRIAMLVAVGGVLYLVGVRGVWLILFAFLVSGVVSAFVLRTPREGAVLGFTSAYRGINARLDASTRAEDHDDDLDDVDGGLRAERDAPQDGTPTATS
jgi:hypothetical protein